MHRKRNWRYCQGVTLPVSFHDCDAMGVVWHGNFLRFCEIARERLLRDRGLNYELFAAKRHFFPVIEEKLRFRKPIRLADRDVMVSAYVMEAENRFVIGYTVCNGQSELCVYGHTVQVAVDAVDGRLLLELPDYVRNAFAPPYLNDHLGKAANGIPGNEDP